ncbi:TetR/AcrR family transcriptional regulator [Acanthopleuribacter pedis]|uniref:TetR/AcrR family transcriptional regulator n=1 Tax=Acanthopleuribacter pedis TaxID=442870 RepID=A0A8J7QN52_9BACT|nr:TetR family transcriptional regulator [Acanthopleuribacter pedis]MBO1321473.1 TetR/AcrR family transcriptional regulator [Acanthopleuribacter pedis]
MQPKRKRGRPRTVEREATVLLAMENYWREGVHTLSVNEICRRTNLSKPALYREFGGEDGLLDAALAHYQKMVIDTMTADIDPNRPFAETLARIVAGLTGPRDTPQGCLLVKVRDNPAAQGPLTQKRVATIVAAMQAGYAALFQQAQARGETRTDISPEPAGRYLDTQINTILRRLAWNEPPEVIAWEACLALSALLPPGTPLDIPTQN